jgi:hypothetical protein
LSPRLLTGLILTLTAVVIVAMFYMMWSGRTTARSERVAIVASVVLAAWGVLTATLASTGFYLPIDTKSAPRVGIQLLVALVALALFLATSASLRSLLTNQRYLIRLNVWRLVGAVFLLLMFAGQVPALWALPAGIGDIIVGTEAFWVASRLGKPGGTRLAVAFNILGLIDLVTAITLGIGTSPGPAQLFHTTPTAELLTHFPLALVPTFLVPLAIMLHVISLWQLSGRSWARPALGA